MEKTIISSKVWVLIDNQGRLIENIDTDQIYHNAYLHLTELYEMGRYALGNLEGWENFSQKARPGDMIVAGRNFGAGSSRQQAVDCFRALNISGILAPSFGAIYFRNAVNSALPVIKCPDLSSLVKEKNLETGDEVWVNYRSGKGKILNRNISFPVEPMSDVQYHILKAGGLFNYGKSLNSSP